MSFGFFGIQFGWGLQMANMSAIYQYLGAREDQIAWLWIAAPLTGLLVQPLVGYFSDRLTTAATIWLSAALGMGIGGGELIFVAVSTVVVLIVLFVFPYLERWIDQCREARSYKIVIANTDIKGADKI